MNIGRILHLKMQIYVDGSEHWDWNTAEAVTHAKDKNN